MKSIIVVALHYRTPDQQGGLRTWHMARALNRNFNVTVLTFAIDTLTGERHKSSSRYCLWNKTNESGFTVYRVNSFPCNRSSKIGRVFYYVSASFLQFLCLLSLILRHDLMIATSHPLTSLFPSVILAKLFRKKIIADVRDLPFDVAEDMGYVRSKYVAEAMRRIESWSLKSCVVVLSVSKGMIDRLRHRLAINTEYRYVPIGYDFLNDLEISPEIEKRLANKPSVRVCLTGTLGHLINVGLLLSVAERYIDDDRIDFVIAGDGQLFSKYLDVVNQKKLRITMLGRIPKSQVHFVCANADICLYPLIGGEATASMQGNKIFDYLGAGKATIYSGADGDVAKLISENNVGYVLDGDNVSGVCKILDGILDGTESSRLDEIRERAEFLVTEKYDVRLIMRELTESLDGLV